MNLEKIKGIVNDDKLSDPVKRAFIIHEIASDEKAMPDILEVLFIQRSESNELVKDLNLELSRMSAYAAMPKRKLKGKDGFSQDFVFGEMWKMYSKWAGRIGHLFNMKPFTTEFNNVTN